MLPKIFSYILLEELLQLSLQFISNKFFVHLWSIIESQFLLIWIFHVCLWGVIMCYLFSHLNIVPVPFVGITFLIALHWWFCIFGLSNYLLHLFLDMFFWYFQWSWEFTIDAIWTNKFVQLSMYCFPTSYEPFFARLCDTELDLEAISALPAGPILDFANRGC